MDELRGLLLHEIDIALGTTFVWMMTKRQPASQSGTHHVISLSDDDFTRPDPVPMSIPFSAGADIVRYRRNGHQPISYRSERDELTLTALRQDPDAPMIVTFISGLVRWCHDQRIADRIADSVSGTLSPDDEFVLDMNELYEALLGPFQMISEVHRRNRGGVASETSAQFLRSLGLRDDVIPALRPAHAQPPKHPSTEGLLH